MNITEARTAKLLNEYGQAKFRDKWDPPVRSAALGAEQVRRGKVRRRVVAGQPVGVPRARAGRRAVPPARRGDQRPGCGRRRVTQPQLPPRVVLTCPANASHKIRTRQPPASVLLCTACGQSGRHGVTVTVPAPLPAVRPPLPASPEGLAIISRRKTAPERWCCSSCRGSAATPAPGLPVAGLVDIGAERGPAAALTGKLPGDRLVLEPAPRVSCRCLGERRSIPGQ